MIQNEYNDGIINFSSSMNYNGQASLIFEETIDINKINEEYSHLKAKINKKSPDFATPKFSKQNLTNSSFEETELNYTYDCKKLGIEIDLEFQVLLERNL